MKSLTRWHVTRQASRNDAAHLVVHPLRQGTSTGIAHEAARAEVPGKGEVALGI